MFNLESSLRGIGVDQAHLTMVYQGKPVALFQDLRARRRITSRHSSLERASQATTKSRLMFPATERAHTSFPDT